MMHGTPERKPHATRFERTFDVADADIDQLGHVNNLVYLRWAQEIAIAHWRHAATPEQQEQIVWVALRHEIDYKKPAGPGDRIVAVTWVGEARGPRWDRHVEILRLPDRDLLARARTVWCPLDARSRRPRRVDRAIEDRFHDPGPHRP